MVKWSYCKKEGLLLKILFLYVNRFVHIYGLFFIFAKKNFSLKVHVLNNELFSLRLQFYKYHDSMCSYISVYANWKTFKASIYGYFLSHFDPFSCSFLINSNVMHPLMLRTPQSHQIIFLSFSFTSVLDALKWYANMKVTW